jgi:hypothetical protein
MVHQDTLLRRKAELRTYLSRPLERQGFRFAQLKGLVDERMLRNLTAASAFADSDSRLFIRRLKEAEPGLKTEVMDAIDLNRAMGKPPIESVRAIEGIFTRFGIHARAKPYRAGMIMASGTLAEGLPYRVYLGEAYGNRMEYGRFVPDSTTHPIGYIEINAAASAARAAEIFDRWLMKKEVIDWIGTHARERSPEEESFKTRIILSRMQENSLHLFVHPEQVSPENLDTNFSLSIACLRLMIDDARRLALTGNSPSGILLRAVNSSLSSVLTHEAAHHEDIRGTRTSFSKRSIRIRRRLS